MSAYRGVTIWRYDLTTAEVLPIGKHLVMFRRYPRSELATVEIPHAAAEFDVRYCFNIE